MSITTCPHCQMRVLPRADGTCPSCNGLISQTEAPPPRPSGAVIQRGKAPVARGKKPASKAGARSQPPSAPNAKDLEPAFQDYLQTAREVGKDSMRVFYPYLAGGIVLAVVCVGVSFLTWDQVVADAGFSNRPSPATWVLIGLGGVLLLASVVLGAIKGLDWGKVQVRHIAQNKPGFPDFYKAFQRRFWPKDGALAGPAYEKFLAILGKK